MEEHEKQELFFHAGGIQIPPIQKRGLVKGNQPLVLFTVAGSSFIIFTSKRRSSFEAAFGVVPVAAIANAVAFDRTVHYIVHLA